jgi:hypothetical protein
LQGQIMILRMLSVTFVAMAGAGNAHAEPLADPQRALAAQAQAQQEQRIERARERCIANRGTDCDTAAGLREWLLLDRTRAEAVLDRVLPGGSASAGASGPVSPDLPDVSGRQD